MQCCCILWTGLTAWFHSYTVVQKWAIVLLYSQVLCSLVGSLGAFYTGVLVANLALALFGLVAIESGSQTLARAYAALLACALLVDILWFVIFALESRKDAASEKFSMFSVKIVFWMQVTGFTARFFSSFLFLQIYRLGAAADNSAMYQPVDFENRISTFGFTNERSFPSRSVSISEEILGGSIHNLSTFSSQIQFVEEGHFGTEAENEATAFNGPNMNSNAQPSDLLLGKETQRFGVT